MNQYKTSYFVRRIRQHRNLFKSPRALQEMLLVVKEAYDMGNADMIRLVAEKLRNRLVKQGF